MATVWLALFIPVLVVVAKPLVERARGEAEPAGA
jgi:hypothetical protein